MVANIISLSLLVLLAALFAWLTTRAWRAKRGLVKWPGVILAGLLTLVFATVAVVAVLGFVKLEVRHTNPVADLKVAGTAEQITSVAANLRGAAPTATRRHRSHRWAAAPKLPRRRAAPRCDVRPQSDTRRPLKGWTDGEIVRAIREGVDHGGRTLVIMPSQVYRNFSDADVQALVAYLRSQPAVDNPQPARNLNVLAALFLGTGMFPISAQPPAGSVAAPPAGPTAAYGKYLISSVGGCADCHRHQARRRPQQFVCTAGAATQAVRRRVQRGAVLCGLPRRPPT